MNNSQRNFLIEKIEKTTQLRIKVLRDSIEDKPDLSNYLLHALMSGNLNVIPNKDIVEILKQRSLKSTDSKSWLGGNSWHATKNAVSFKFEEFFVIPEDYKPLYDAWENRKKETEEEIYLLSAQLDGLITRIKLASNSTLESLIKEIDDMGNINLIDTKIKLLQ